MIWSDYQKNIGEIKCDLRKSQVNTELENYTTFSSHCAMCICHFFHSLGPSVVTADWALLLNCLNFYGWVVHSSLSFNQRPEIDYWVPEYPAWWLLIPYIAQLGYSIAYPGRIVIWDWAFLIWIHTLKISRNCPDYKIWVYKLY